MRLVYILHGRRSKGGTRKIFLGHLYVTFFFFRWSVEEGQATLSVMHQVPALCTGRAGLLLFPFFLGSTYFDGLCVCDSVNWTSKLLFHSLENQRVASLISSLFITRHTTQARECKCFDSQGLFVWIKIHTSQIHRIYAIGS